jgi:hypothetical protein
MSLDRFQVRQDRCDFIMLEGEFWRVGIANFEHGKKPAPNNLEATHAVTLRTITARKEPRRSALWSSLFVPFT